MTPSQRDLFENPLVSNQVQLLIIVATIVSVSSRRTNNKFWCIDYARRYRATASSKSLLGIWLCSTCWLSSGAAPILGKSSGEALFFFLFSGLLRPYFERHDLGFQEENGYISARYVLYKGCPSYRTSCGLSLKLCRLILQFNSLRSGSPAIDRLWCFTYENSFEDWWVNHSTTHIWGFLSTRVRAPKTSALNSFLLWCSNVLQKILVLISLLVLPLEETRLLPINWTC